MNLEQLKKEFIELKKEQLKYIADVTSLSKEKKFTEQEKIKIYRDIKKYEKEISDLAKTIIETMKKENIKFRFNDVVIEFDLNNYYDSLKIDNQYRKEYVLNILDVKNNKCKFTFQNLQRISNNNFKTLDPDLIENGQRLINKPIYIFCGYYDYREDCYGPCFGNEDDYIHGIYKIIFLDEKKEIIKNKMGQFEKDKVIIRTEQYVNDYDIENIFRNELLNPKNNTIDDCINNTRKIIKTINYLRSPEYKEKILLDKINELYEKVKGNCINEELLYSGKFLSILKEIYELPNNKIVEKEKIIKNNGKNSVIIIAITKDNKYIITFQNRLKNKMIAEFPSGYIENDEDILTAAKRELMEEAGYTSNDLFVLDQAYTSVGIDNSISYIVIANNCIKTDNICHEGTEFLTYDLFSKQELEYLINNNIMNGSMNKLAYYNLICNIDDNKRLKKKNINPLR